MTFKGMREEIPMNRKSTADQTQRRNRTRTWTIVAGCTVASMLASGAVAQASLPTPGTGSAPVASAPAVSPMAQVRSHPVPTMRGYERVQVKPAVGNDGISSTALIITLAGLGGIALAIPATRVYRRQHAQGVANA
jgi:hypothetical protein